MENTPAPRFNLLLLLSLILLIPIFQVAYTYALKPALQTIEYSYSDYSLLNEPEFIGNDNYERMQEDERYQRVQTFSRRIVWMRLAVIAVLPALVGLLIGVQGWVLRGVN